MPFMLYVWVFFVGGLSVRTVTVHPNPDYYHNRLAEKFLVLVHISFLLI